MKIWLMLLYICLAGAVGGIINAILTGGFVKPYKFVREQQGRIKGIKFYNPGSIGTVLTGAIASGISWGLYGPFAAHVIYPPPPATPDAPEIGGLTLASLVGAVLVGIGGARWLHSEVDKSMLKTAAIIATELGPAPELAAGLSDASPAEVLTTTQQLEDASKK